MAEVQAIKNLSDIQKIKNNLAKKENKRDYTLFIFGINVGLRASDILKLKVADVYNIDGSVKDKVELIEQKTKKQRVVKLNKSVVDALTEYYNQANFTDGDNYIFASRKGIEAIEVRSLNRLVKEWCDAARLKGNYGSHSLRKTFGYHCYMNNSANPRILHTLQKTFNHSSESVTLRYIGIEQDEIESLYDDLCL